MKLIWKPVTECDNDNGNHTVWSVEVNHAVYGKYLWISMDNGVLGKSLVDTKEALV